jgi:hypothetical protein
VAALLARLHICLLAAIAPAATCCIPFRASCPLPCLTCASGTPPTPQFLSVLIRPNAKHTARLRKLLAQTFGGVGSEHYSAEGAGGDDMFPYVCFTLNIE